MREYQICLRCVMDTSDPDIVFDENGICNHCKTVDAFYKSLPPVEKREERLLSLLDNIKARRTGKYDCVVGVSGGLDSTYLIHYLKEHGMNPLAVHIDNGWNTETSVLNLDRVLKPLKVDLETVVLEWELFRDLQLAFLKASVPDLEIPTDHSLRAVINDIAKKNKVAFIFNGTNFNTESILPRAWSRSQSDWLLIKSIYKRFGKGLKINRYPHSNLVSIIFDRFSGLTRVSLLDNIRYNKGLAMKVLSEKYNWEYYGGKHYESVYTRFFQGYILPRKFGIDKRRAHLSSLICSGEITRERAINELAKDPYPDKELLSQDKKTFTSKLGLSETELEELLALPNKSTGSYPNYENTFPYNLFYRSFRDFVLKRNRRNIVLKNNEPQCDT